MQGYAGKLLRVNLTTGEIRAEALDEVFCRRYLGGWGFIGYYLLKEVPRGADPLGPDNILIFATGPVTSHPAAGNGRNAVGCKSPLTGGFLSSEVGGFWPAEFKKAGYDALIVEGVSPKPVYLLLREGQEPELRDASHLWGKTTSETHELLVAELGDKWIREAAIGPAGENQVLTSSVINDFQRAAGRGGTGAVMGSKRLKAVVCRARRGPAAAQPEKIKELAKDFGKVVKQLNGRLWELGTAGGVISNHASGNLPTLNFRDGSFEGGYETLSGEYLRDTYLVDRETCYACSVICKRVAEVPDGPYQTHRKHGGPEYETIGSLGSMAGVADMAAVVKANALCNDYGLDTIGCGVTIAWAIECFERGLITTADTGGLELRFGDAAMMVKLVEMTAKREGFGDLLALGSWKAAQKIGRGTERYSMTVKGQEIPMHEPRLKQGLGIGYMFSPTGADHMHNMHDTMFTTSVAAVHDLGILEPMATNDLGPNKMRLLRYVTDWRVMTNCLVLCNFPAWTRDQTLELTRAATGWNIGTWELMKIGERAMALARAFNYREGFTPQDDRLPDRFYEPHTQGEEGVNKLPGIDRVAAARALQTLYRLRGYDALTGAPTRATLEDLDIAWVADAIGLPGGPEPAAVAPAPAGRPGVEASNY
jgi:aldehyde:ferredoxin oxidoreductase